MVNLATVPLLEHVNNTSARFGPDVDESSALDLPMEPSAHVRPLRVISSPASLECTLHSSHELGDFTLVLGNVVAFTVKDGVMVDGHPEFARLEPLSRLGRNEWGLPSGVVSTPRPDRPEDVR